MPVAIPVRLSRALQEHLGRETADSLVDWMVKVESDRSELRELRAIVERSHARMEELMQRFGGLEVSIERRFGDIDAKIERRLGETDARIERRFAELMKWSFLFWVGAVGAIAALAGVLR
jgi:hypothetical protein